MSKRPIILFPQPEIVTRSKLFGGLGSLEFPSHKRQVERLSPMFEELQAAFNKRKVAIEETAAGSDPDQVLVIEIIGSIVDFAKAVKKIEGFEWLNEFEVDDIPPTKDFYDRKAIEKELPVRLYFIMTNQKALGQLLSLWHLYKSDENAKFKRGLKKFLQLFKHLNTIRRWGVKDRLSDDGTLKAWEEDLNEERPVKCEIEFWYRRDSKKRALARSQIESLVYQSNGKVISECIVEGISYHGLLVEISSALVHKIISKNPVELIKAEAVMFFGPAGQIANRHTTSLTIEQMHFDEKPLPKGDPIVAILDGLPLENHPLLSKRLIVDDPDGFASTYPASQRVHGTAMASLILHGDLGNPVNLPLPSPVYVRPIMKPCLRSMNPDSADEVPVDNVLLVDLIHRAVKRLFEGEGNEKAVAPSVKIINLSIGDRYRPFVYWMSPTARVIDWLSAKYNVLFVISAGNHPTPIDIGLPYPQLAKLSPEEREAVIVRALFREARLRKLLSPAESMNSITVGSVHVDDSSLGYIGQSFDPFKAILPSPASAFGSGRKRGIKPDIVLPGGKLLYQESLGSSELTVIKPVRSHRVSGNKVASPGAGSGNFGSFSFCQGTSNSASLASRMGGFCYDYLVEIFQKQRPDLDYDPFMPSLLKAMIVHGSCWGEMGNRLREILNISENEHLVSTLIGYGMPDINRVLGSTDQRASLIGFGSLSNDNAHTFRMPLPPSLSSRREWRRITVTLAYFSPIAPSTQKYRTASLWFEVEKSDLAARSDADWRAVRRGALQHEVFEGEQAIALSDGDSLKIKVNCRSDAEKILVPIHYGLIVSFEVREGVDIPVYDEIQIRIALPIRI